MHVVGDARALPVVCAVLVHIVWATCAVCVVWFMYVARAVSHVWFVGGVNDVQTRCVAAMYA